MPLSKILVDRSFLIALYDQSAIEHEEVEEIAKLYRRQFLMTNVKHFDERENRCWCSVPNGETFQIRPFGWQGAEETLHDGMVITILS